MPRGSVPDVGIYPGGTTILELSENAARLDTAGFAGFWVGDSNHDAFVTAAAIAASIKHTAVGTAVALLSRTPAQTVIASTSLMEMMGGRFFLGFGMGPEIRNVNWHGIPWVRPAERMREYIRAVRACWEARPGRPASYEGSFYTIRDFNRVRPIVPDPLPVYLAVVGQQMCRVAGEVADGVLLNNVHTQRWVRERTMPWVAEGAARAGRNVENQRLGVVRYTAIHPDRRIAYHRARHNLAYSARYPYNHPLLDFAGFEAERRAISTAWEREDVEAAVSAVSDPMVEAMAFAGTKDDVRCQLASWSDDVDFVILAPAAYNLDAAEASDSAARVVEAFAR